MFTTKITSIYCVLTIWETLCSLSICTYYFTRFLKPHTEMNSRDHVEAVRGWGNCHVPQLSIRLGQVTVTEASALWLQSLDQCEKCRRRLFPSHLNRKEIFDSSSLYDVIQVSFRAVLKKTHSQGWDYNQDSLNFSGSKLQVYLGFIFLPLHHLQLATKYCQFSLQAVP